MKKKVFYYLYLVLGTASLVAFSGIHYYGWGLTSTEKLTVPKTVRDNPSSYRSHYHGGK